MSQSLFYRAVLGLESEPTRWLLGNFFNCLTMGFGRASAAYCSNSSLPHQLHWRDPTTTKERETLTFGIWVNFTNFRGIFLFLIGIDFLVNFNFDFVFLFPCSWLRGFGNLR